jgi:hypothetical protein
VPACFCERLLQLIPPDELTNFERSHAELRAALIVVGGMRRTSDIFVRLLRSGMMPCAAQSFHSHHREWPEDGPNPIRGCRDRPEMRTQAAESFKSFNDSLLKSTAEIANMQAGQLTRLAESSDQKLEAMRAGRERQKVGADTTNRGRAVAGQRNSGYLSAHALNAACKS